LSHWITTQEAADLSGFHPEYLRRLARQGKISAEKKGRDWRIDRDVLHAYLQTVEDLSPQKYDPRGQVIAGEISVFDDSSCTGTL
jgi:excisionase family DNA binding protein